MSLPKAYLTSTKRLGSILGAIRGAQSPTRFTSRFLNTLGFKTSSDSLIISVLKSLGFLSADGAPTERYFAFLDNTRYKSVLAEGIQDSYSDLFQIDVNAHKLKRSEVKNKFRTLTQGKLSDSVLDKLAMTFCGLVKHADFEVSSKSVLAKETLLAADLSVTRKEERHDVVRDVNLGGLVYNIQLILPESRDPAVYDALFRSLKEHLL